MAKMLKKFFIILIASIIIFIWLIPMFYILLTAVRPTRDFYMYGMFAFPRRIELANFVIAWQRISGFYFNSIIVTGVTIPILLLVSSLAAYAFARMKFMFSELILMIFLIGFMIPAAVTVFPLYHMFLNMGLLDSHWSLISTGVAFGIPFNVYLMRGYIKGVPAEIEDSARIDGCSSLKIYSHIILPLARPILMIAAVLGFLAAWNEFFFALTFLQSRDRMTITIGLQTFIQEWSAQYNLMTAGIVISAIPALLLFIFFQKYLVIGLSEGALKG